MSRATLRWFRWIGLAMTLLVIAWFVPAIHGRFVTFLAPGVIFVRVQTEKIADNFAVIKAIPQLTGENRALLNQVREFEALSIVNQELLHENEVLRQELEFVKANSASQFVAAQVISRTSSVIGQKILINKGSDDGFVRGMAVVAQGHLVGQVSDTTPTSSTVNLITSPTSLVPSILQQSRSVGLLRGGADGLIVEEIPHDVTITPGEALVTSALANVVKSGLPIGTVTAVLGSKSDVFQSARISSPIDFGRLEIVFGVK